MAGLDYAVHAVSDNVYALHPVAAIALRVIRKRCSSQLCHYYSQIHCSTSYSTALLIHNNMSTGYREYSLIGQLL